MTQFRIAIVVPSVTQGGGVPTVANFLYETLANSEIYEPYLISLATSWRDQTSVRITAPQSWFQGVQTSDGLWRERHYRHVGALFTELEFQRYKPRNILTTLLNQYDLVQVVAGTPAWGFVAHNVQCPVCLFVATTTKNERATLIETMSGKKKAWISFMTKIATRLEQKALSKAAFIFAESKYTYRELSKVIDEASLLLGPPGVNTELFVPSSKSAGTYILAVGRFQDPRKNVRLLFQAYQQLSITLPSFPRLVLAGKSVPSLSDWQYAKDLKITEYIEIRQDIPTSELAQLYRDASIFVLSSDEEGLGIVILEAMASGLPVVATQCGGPETAVIDGVSGYLTPVGDANLLAQRLMELILDPVKRRTMGQMGRQLAEEQFSAQIAGKTYLEAYGKLLSSK
ncbi:MAG: glycosyltransferase family 4 protein [Caldilineaceae bacterium]